MNGPDTSELGGLLSVVAFYDGLAADYQLVYANWDAAVDRQGAALDSLIRQARPNAADVLDCSCGIGTQAIGLARLGYRVHGSDVSGAEVERARSEAARLGAAVTFGVADFRDLRGVTGDFDVVISCDNAIPHLLDKQDVVRALHEMRSKLRPGGLLVVTMRDFDQAAIDRPAAAPLVDVPGPPRQVVVRLHDWDADRPVYTVRYLVLTEQTNGWTTIEHATRYRAIPRDELARAASAAGFVDVVWHGRELVVVGDQRVLTAHNPGS
jgi:glycine/sarcosine N-methyltransferase